MEDNATTTKSGWWRRVVDGLKLGRLRTRNRRLRLCEQLPLGERRFVAIIECDQQQFLIGGSATQVQLLARLDPASGPVLAGARESVSAGSEFLPPTVK